MFRVDSADVEGTRTLKLSGVIDEHADLGFFTGLHGAVRINMRAVRRINSYGVRSWMDAVRKMPADCRLELTECPPPVVDQLNMVAGFAGRGQVVSFFAPLMCSKCEHEMDHLFQVAACKANSGKLTPVACPKCKGKMELDDVEDQYLCFVREG
jgi:hypothetical protein